MGGDLFDVLVIGGGPAGLSAAIYAARFNRRTLVIDRGFGRSTTHEVNENYLGFPGGIASKELRELGREQARRFGAELVADDVTAMRCEDGRFLLSSGRRDFAGRALIFATGARDLFPLFEGVEDYVGRSLFWCITCDGWKTRGRRVMVVGHHDESAVTALQFLGFTDAITLVTNRRPGEDELSGERRDHLRDAGIPLHDACIAEVDGEDGMLARVRLDDGSEVELDFMFNQQGSKPNSELARAAGVATSPSGWINVDLEQRTNVPRVYAAGDVTRIFAHQIVTAAHEGATAGQAANYDLYAPWQRDDNRPSARPAASHADRR